MQWIVGHRFKFYLVIYIRYWNAIDSLQWNIKSTSELDFEGASTPISPNGSCSKFIYHVGTVHEDQIGSRFT